MTNDVSFYALTVSQNHVRLFHATPDEFVELPVPGMPASMAEIAGAAEAEIGLYFRTGQPQAHGKEALVFHGQGGSADALKPKLAAFVRTIERAVAKRIDGGSLPLVFAGVDSLFAMYRAENTYPHLLPIHVSGNTDSLPLDAIRRSALSLVQAAARDRRSVAMATYWNLATHGRTSNHLDEVLAAAESGAVETLFIDPLEHRLGSFDPQTLETRIAEQPGTGGEDLINVAAALALTHGAAIECLPAGYIPGGGVIAAVMRYPATAFQGLAAHGKVEALRNV